MAATKRPGATIGLRWRVEKRASDDIPEPSRSSLPSTFRPLAVEPPPPHRAEFGEPAQPPVVDEPVPDGVSIIKAYHLKGPTEESQAAPGLLEERQIAQEEKLGLIAPPYDFEKLLALYESSSGLRPNIDVLATNVDSFGHHFEPAINLNAQDAPDRVRTALLLEQLGKIEETQPARTNGGAPPIDLEASLSTFDDIEEPSAEEVNDRLERLRKLALVELHKLRAFFSFSNPDGSFSALRMKTREEREILGNGFWEILRSKDGKIARFVHIPAVTMRLGVQDRESTSVEEPVRISDLAWRMVPQRRFFRRYAQVDTQKLTGEGSTEAIVAWFKEFGDPRYVSRKTGEAYGTEAQMKKKEPDAALATEILHFVNWSPRTPYGIPRWIGNLPGVLGSRELDQVNESYFDNNAVPPLVILANGGRFARGVTDRIRDFFVTQVKGQRSTHSVLILEAEPAASVTSPTGPRQLPSISFEHLRDVQQQDALFQEYDKRNSEKLAMSFRLPSILRGEAAGTTRAAALSALRQAEQQVFGPERDEFDDVINRKIIPALCVTFWSFKSNAPSVRDPEALTEAVVDLTRYGVLTPAEAREFASNIFNRELPPIKEAWALRPLAITIAGLKAVSGPAEAARVSEGQSTDPQELLDALQLPVEEAAILTQPKKPKVVEEEEDEEEKPRRDA